MHHYRYILWNFSLTIHFLELCTAFIVRTKIYLYYLRYSLHRQCVWYTSVPRFHLKMLISNVPTLGVALPQNGPVWRSFLSIGDCQPFLLVIEPTSFQYPLLRKRHIRLAVRWSVPIRGHFCPINRVLDKTYIMFRAIDFIREWRARSGDDRWPDDPQGNRVCPPDYIDSTPIRDTLYQSQF